MSDAEMEEAASRRAEAVAKACVYARKAKKAATTVRGFVAICVCVTGIVVTIFWAVNSGVVVAIAGLAKDFIDLVIGIEEEV